MSQELLYTSAPKGLKPGSRGFCTVLSTQGMSAPLATAVEGLSAYRPIYPVNDERASRNPVVYSHLKMQAAGRSWDVLSRIADYGLDYSQRANKLAHHVILDNPSERLPGGPANLLSMPGFMREDWEGEPKLVGIKPITREPRPPSGICERWKEVTGDAGWAGVVAESFLREPDRLVILLFEPGQEVLPLFAEVLSLLPPEKRWDATFSTYFTGLATGTTCNWRAMVHDSKEAHESMRFVNALRIDLTTDSLGDANGGEFVDAARLLPSLRPQATADVRHPASTPKSNEGEEKEFRDLSSKQPPPRMSFARRMPPSVPNSRISQNSQRSQDRGAGNMFSYGWVLLAVSAAVLLSATSFVIARLMLPPQKQDEIAAETALAGPKADLGTNAVASTQSSTHGKGTVTAGASSQRQELSSESSHLRTIADSHGAPPLSGILRQPTAETPGATDLKGAAVPSRDDQTDHRADVSNETATVNNSEGIPITVVSPQDKKFETVIIPDDGAWTDLCHIATAAHAELPEVKLLRPRWLDIFIENASPDQLNNHDAGISIFEKSGTEESKFALGVIAWKRNTTDGTSTFSMKHFDGEKSKVLNLCRTQIKPAPEGDAVRVISFVHLPIEVAGREFKNGGKGLSWNITSLVPDSISLKVDVDNITVIIDEHPFHYGPFPKSNTHGSSIMCTDIEAYACEQFAIRKTDNKSSPPHIEVVVNGGKVVLKMTHVQSFFKKLDADFKKTMQNKVRTVMLSLSNANALSLQENSRLYLDTVKNIEEERADAASLELWRDLQSLTRDATRHLQKAVASVEADVNTREAALRALEDLKNSSSLCEQRTRFDAFKASFDKIRVLATRVSYELQDAANPSAEAVKVNIIDFGATEPDDRISSAKEE